MNKLKIFFNKFDVHMQELLRGSFFAFVLKVLAAGFAFGLNVILARELGAKGSGVFFLSFTIVFIVATIARLGMENSLVRFIAANIVAEKYCKVFGVYQKVIKYSLIMSFLLAIILYFLTPWLSREVFSKEELELPLSFMALSVLPLALSILHASALQGLKQISSSIFVLSVIVPFLTGLGALLFVSDYGLVSVAISNVLATIVALLLGVFFWRRATKSFECSSLYFDTKQLFNSSTPLFVMALMTMIITWAPLLFLGVWETSENVGIYSAASRTAMLTSFILVAVNRIAAPKFSALYQQRDMEGLAHVARSSSKIMISLALPVVLFFLLFPELILSLFGDEFRQGALVLMILSIGQFINVATGSVGYLLIMTGNEKLMRNNLVFSSIIGITLICLLIPEYGITGAAFAASFTLSIQNLVAMFLVWKKFNIVIIPWFFK